MITEKRTEDKAPKARVRILIPFIDAQKRNFLGRFIGKASCREIRTVDRFVENKICAKGDPVLKTANASNSHTVLRPRASSV